MQIFYDALPHPTHAALAITRAPASALTQITAVLSLTLILAVGVAWIQPAAGQICGGPADKTLTTQTQIDDFQTTYGPCTEVTGNLTINDGTITNITNVDGLSDLTDIGGRLLLRDLDALTNVDGFSGLTSVGNLLVRANDALTNVDGFSGLTSVGNLLVTENDKLANVDGFSNLPDIEDLTISGNDKLVNVDGFSSLTLVVNLQVGNNDELKNVNGLSSLTIVAGNLSILGNADLANVDGLSGLTFIGGDLSVARNIKLTNIDGLSGLTSSNGDIVVSNNDMLTNVDGLSGITSVLGNLLVQSNLILFDINGLANVTGEIGGTLSIFENAELTSVDGLSGITSVVDDLVVQSNDDLTNVDGLANVTSVGSELRVRNNDKLPSIDGLLGINSVGGNLVVQFNDDLTDVDGLANIISVGSALIVKSNNQLSRCNCGLYDLLTSPGAIGGTTAINSNASGCNSDTEVINQGPCVTSDCTATTLTESAPYVGSDGAGRVDLTFSTPDGIEEIDFSLLDNLELASSRPAFDTETTGADGLPTYTYGAAPPEIDITLRQVDVGNENAGYFGIARSVCPGVEGDQLAVEFDPPLEFALHVPDRLELMGAWPNPTPGAATVGFALPEASDVRLAVYDAVGRRVATLADGRYEAGRHELRWDGRSGAGLRLASGLYLVRLEAGAQTRTSRLTVVR
jgi:hypothetical protein